MKTIQFISEVLDYHFRVSAKQRLSFFLGNNFMIMDNLKVRADPLKFKDNKKYSERLKEAQKITVLMIPFLSHLEQLRREKGNGCNS